MASGFIILHDGRCFARRWTFYDAAINGVIDELINSPAEKDLATWLRGLLPGPDDIDIDYCWIRKSDNENVLRHLDLRELTVDNHQRFYAAARRALHRLQFTDTSKLHKDWILCLSILVEMIDRAEKGEPPLSMSDWVSVEPESGMHSGPGWDQSIHQ